MCKKVVITNHKGGPGATTLATNAGDWLARHGQKTAIFGLDHQTNVEMLLDVRFGQEAVKYLERVIEYPEEALQPATSGKLLRENLFYVPGNGELLPFADALASQLSRKTSDEDRLALLRVVGDRIYSIGDSLENHPFDVVIADPPKSGALQQAAVASADCLIIPFQYNYMTMSNTISMMDLAHALMPEMSRIVLLPMGGTMIWQEENKKAGWVFKYNKTYTEAMNGLMSHAATLDRCITLSDGIIMRQSAPSASFKGKTIFEAQPNGLLAKSVDNFCHKIFGL